MNSFIEIAIGTVILVTGVTLLFAGIAYVLHLLFFKNHR